MERKSISSYKSKKKKKKSKSPLSAPVEYEGQDQPSSPSSKKRLSQLGKKSFQKLAKAAKLGRSFSSSSEKAPSIDEVDEGNDDDVIPEEVEEEEREEFAVFQTPVPEHEQLQQQPPRKKRPPPRPKAITLKQDSQQMMENTPTVTVTPSLDTDPYSSAFQEGGEVLGGQQHEKRRPVPHPRQCKEEDTKSRQSPHRLTTKVRTRSHPAADEEFFVINYVHMCVCGLWLCVANNGGNVMAFSFNSKPSKHSRPAGVSY